MKLKTKPYPHQVKAMRRALAQKSHAFFFEPRCGKTKAVLDTLAVLANRGEVRRVVVIAPIIALDVWVREIETHMAVTTTVSQLGEPLRTIGEGESMLHMLLINYDKFSRRGNEQAFKNKYLMAVERWSPDVIVLDESHRVKSAGAVRSQALWRMVHRLRLRGQDKPYVMLLSGTPNPKSYLDVFSQYRIMDPSIFGMTAKKDFEESFIVYGYGRRRFQIIRYRDKPKLLRLIRSRASIVTQEEAGLRGQEFFNPIRIDLPAKVRDHYVRFAEDLILEIGSTTIEAPNPAVRRLRLLQMTGGFTTDGKAIHRAKLEAIADYLADLITQDESVVVYARYIPEVKALEQVCRKVGYRTAAIHGAIPPKARTQAIADFQHGDVPHALVFQCEAGALAIELTAAAESVFYSLPDSWESFYQATQRLAGPKQTRPVRHTFILARGTVDESVLHTLRSKKNLHAEMMDHPRAFLFGL